MTELTKIIKNCLENIHEISLSKFNYEYGNNYIRINGNYNMYMSFKQDLCELDALNNITEYLRGKLCSRRDNYIISTNSS